jgi:NAD(P)-dependent dehydrogenase (short-subunit alcohol dehydrogenase family)
MSLQHKVGIVTGAGHGMGRAYAEGLVEQGASVLVTDIDVEAAQAAARHIETQWPWPSVATLPMMTRCRPSLRPLSSVSVVSTF